MRLPAGTLREKIVIERPSRIPNESGGGDTLFTEILRTFSRVREISPSSEQIANQENLITLIEFTMRYRPDVYLEIGDRITWRGFYYIIGGSMKVDPFRTAITITASAEMETSER